MLFVSPIFLQNSVNSMKLPYFATVWEAQGGADPPKNLPTKLRIRVEGEEETLFGGSVCSYL